MFQTSSSAIASVTVGTVLKSLQMAYYKFLVTSISLSFLVRTPVATATLESHDLLIRFFVINFRKVNLLYKSKEMI